MPKETRLQEIKRCLDRATELGGVSLGDDITEAPYDLSVSDVQYLYDKLMKVRAYAHNVQWLDGSEIVDKVKTLIDND